MTTTAPARGRAGFVLVVTGAVLLVLSLSIMDWVHFGDSVGGSPRRSYGLRFLEMGDHVSVVDIGIAAAYFGGLGLLLAALTVILAVVGTRPGDSRLPVRWLAALLAVVAAVLQIVVMAAVGTAEGAGGPGIGSFIGLFGYALVLVGVIVGPARRQAPGPPLGP